MAVFAVENFTRWTESFVFVGPVGRSYPGHHLLRRERERERERESIQCSFSYPKTMETNTNKNNELRGLFFFHILILSE